MGVAKSIVIVGAGGHGREIASLVVSSGRALAGFIDDREPDDRLLAPFGVPYLGSVDYWVGGESLEYLVGVGEGQSRKRLSLTLRDEAAAAPLISPNADLGVDVRSEIGSVIFAQATVTTNVVIGKHVHVGRGAAVGHDCVLEDFVTIMPNASVSGSVFLGEGSTVGAGAVIRQGQRIGEGAFVGAGAVVVKDVPARAVVVGNPAQPIHRS